MGSKLTPAPCIQNNGGLAFAPTPFYSESSLTKNSPSQR